VTRRRALLSFGGTGYITDGLDLWFDGINNTRNGHATSITTWEDLSSNHYDAVSDTAVTVGDNYVPFTGNTIF